MISVTWHPAEACRLRGVLKQGSNHIHTTRGLSAFFRLDHLSIQIRMYCRLVMVSDDNHRKINGGGRRGLRIPVGP